MEDDAEKGVEGEAALLWRKQDSTEPGHTNTPGGESTGGVVMVVGD